MQPSLPRKWPPCVEILDEQSIAMLRAMTGQQRLEAMNTMSIQHREIALYSIHTKHPDWSDEQVRHEYLRRTGLWAPETSSQ